MMKTKDEEEDADDSDDGGVVKDLFFIFYTCSFI